ncbi:MAG TPA: 3-hydroxyacyl-[acyl-carrier-protein] dehydratase FabZ [Thermodesulfobacteriota bacterium]|nr:3-hydroxyacyl-[acyl-carrier-protein] dehydratase FabZ [Thermodesulfobacteriota bacterium]
MMENKEIQSILPHRYPFLLVDRIVSLEPGKRGTGIKNVTGNEWFFNGTKAYPPVLLLESLAQLGGIVLGSKAREENPESRFFGLFAGVSDFHYRRSPILGEQITLKVEVSQSLASIYRFTAEVYVEEEKIAGGQVLLSFTRSPLQK